MKRVLLSLFFIIFSLLFSFAQRSANIVFIGNSITYGALHQQREQTAPPAQCARWLCQREEIDTVYFRNCGRSGRTTYHFLPNAADVVPAGDKTYFSDVVAKTRELVKAHPSLPLVFSIKLGTNDAVERKHNAHTEPEAYVRNLTIIIDSLLCLWPDAHVVLNRPIYNTSDYVTKNGSVASKKSLKMMNAYFEQFSKVVANCKSGHVHIGDAEAYGYFKSHYKSDVFEEKDARGKSYWLHPNEQGAKQLAAYWGKAILPVIKSIPVHPLYGKKIGIIGDSYVRNHRDPIEYTWHYKFAQKYGMQYYNYGKNGNCIALDLKQWGTGMYKRYASMNDSLDYIVIIAGHNDASQGRLDSIGVDLFKERLSVMLSGMRKKYPNGQIFFVTPWRCENFAGSPRQRTIEAIKEVCAKYDVPVFDASRDSNIESDSFDFRKKYFQGGKGTDTAHLNAKGHDLFLPVAEQFLLQHMK